MTAPAEPSEGSPQKAPGEGRKERIRAIARVALGAAMIVVGIDHFVNPEPFAHIVPAYLPAPIALVYLSGAAEIAGGAGLFIPRLRRAASFGLIALYVAVFPANLNMALHDIPLGDHHLPPAALWGRLPFQLLFIALAWWVGKPSPQRSR
jgi:uncharacterized membrane protein